MSIVARPATAPTIAGRPAQPIRVMISSRCNDAFAGKPLRSYRVELQGAIEAARIFGLF